MALAVAAPSLAGAADSILLTSGTVKGVDLERGVIVLDSGRALAVRTILRDGQFVELRAIQPDDNVFVSGTDLGYPTEVASRRAK